MFPLNTQILIVDDMLTMRKIISKIVREMGYTNIKEAADGALAWEELQKPENNIGLIISDWNMPNMSGLDLLKKVRTSDRFKKTPMLLVTAEAEQAQVFEAIKSGVDQYVVKPFTKNQLDAKLQAVAKKYKF